MENLRLLRWTLSVRVDGHALGLSLGDGHRLAHHAQRPAALVHDARQPLAAAELLGADLAARLVASPPRPLNVLYEVDAALDAIDWEHLGVGDTILAERFEFSRQLVSEAEILSDADSELPQALAFAVVHRDVAGSDPRPQSLPLHSLNQPNAREVLAGAQMVVLDDVAIPDFLEPLQGGPQRRLLVLAQPQPLSHLSQALDVGASVLCPPTSAEIRGDSVTWLRQQLGTGLNVGEALRLLHLRSRHQRFGGRLYGDPELRLVRRQVAPSRRQVSSLSFDIVGSTTMITQRGDEAYAETLAAVHARFRDIVRRHGGRPDDPQGDDGAMGYFGHPRALEDSAVRAVEAALAIVPALAEIGVIVRAGVATDVVSIKDGQPVGLSIHLAARLQQLAPPGTVYVSESTQRHVAHAFEMLRLQDPPLLKGIDKPEPVYRVIGPRSDALEVRLERSANLTPLVGRQAELSRLHGCWRATRAGDRRMVVIVAEAGMGKSRLVLEFRHQLVDSGAKVLECRCREDASASPFLALAEALQRWLAITPKDGAEQAMQKLAAAVPGGAREGESLALLAALLGIAPQPLKMEPSSARQRLLGLLLDWLQAFAGNAPGCLIVEDWHWVDPSMREFVDQLVAGREGPGLLVVVTQRPEQGAWPPAAHERLELAGLAPQAARELVGCVCAAGPLSPRVVLLLAARGDGVPLFLEEASRMALELGATSASDELRALEAVPLSLNDLLAARLDALGAAKPVAQVAAVVGRQFTRRLLEALLDAGGYAAEAAALDERLAALTASGLILAEGDGRYAFRHVLIRDAAYFSLWSRQRHALHGQVVALLQQRWPDLAATQPELLARHLDKAGLHDQALAQWELAARAAAARSAEREAISHLQSALAVLERSEAGSLRDRTALRLQLLLAARLLATEGYGADAVLQAYLEAERLCDRIGDVTDRFKVEMGLEAYRFMRADFAPALEHGRRAAAIAAHSGDAKQRLHAHWGLACTLFHQGALRASMREMDSALAQYAPAMHLQFGIQDPGVMCMAYSSWCLWELGHPDSALERINGAVTLANEFRHRFSQAVALAYGVSVQLLRGESDAALARADECLRVCEDAGFPVWGAITRCMRGYLLCERGEIDIGLREMRAGYAQWLATGAMVSQPLYLSLQVEGLILAGQFETALARVEEGLQIIHRYGERQLEAELMRLRGELALRRGEVAEGEAWLKRAYALALRRHRLGFALRSATALARSWAARGRAARARRLLQPLAARWTEGRGTRDLRAASALIQTLE